MELAVYRHNDFTRVADLIRAQTGVNDKISFPQGLKTSILNMKQNYESKHDLTEYTNEEITALRDYAFCQCENLQSVSFPNVTTIGHDCFYKCTALQSADISSVINVQDNVFYHCTSLESIDISSATSIGTYSFYSCYGLQTVDMPNVETTVYQPFRDCKNITSFNAPKLKTVGYGTFYDCTNLSFIHLPEATSIGNRAFMQAGIVTAKLPKAQTIDTYAFNKCPNIVALVIEQNDSVCTLTTTNAFNATPIANGTGFIYVPDTLVESYKTATNWSTFANQIKPLSEYVENSGV